MSIASSEARIFVDVDLSANLVVNLEGGQAHYLRNVLRLAVGQRIGLFNGRDGEWLCQITAVGKRHVEVEIIKKSRAQDTSKDIWLAFAPIKKARVDYIAQKATELGVSVIWPIFTKFTAMSRINLDRLHANAIEASEQSGRLSVPEIRSSVDFGQFIKDWPSNRTLFCLDETGGGIPILGAFRSEKAELAGILVGPEGGFSNEELDQVDKLSNVCRVGLGKKILRSETAAVAALSCWQASVGDWI